MLVCVNIAKSVITIKTEVVPYEMSCHLEQITEILNETGSVITQINRQTSTLNKKRIFFGGGAEGYPISANILYSELNCPLSTIIFF